MYSFINVMGNALRISKVASFLQYKNVCKCIPSSIFYNSSKHYHKLCSDLTNKDKAIQNVNPIVKVKFLIPDSPVFMNLLYKSNVSFNSKNVESFKSRNIKSLSAYIVDKSSSSIQPYLQLMRIDRPIGTWLLFYPCTWGIGMAAAPGCFPDLMLLALFGCGALIMRGAGCTINDMWDKDIDGKVIRTKDRPLVTGKISQWDALVFLSGQLGIGCMVLLQLNWFSVLLGASSLGLIITYPLMKRITYWPQLMLGMAFNWGSLLGWSAVHGSCDWAVCLPLYTAGICWTIVYDTIYAHQDRVDDIMLGIKSTAIKFGDQTQLILSLFGSAMIGGLLLSGYQCDQTWPYYSAVTIIAMHLANQLYDLNINNPSECGRKFISNQRVGLILFLGIVIGNLIKSKKEEKIPVS